MACATTRSRGKLCVKCSDPQLIEFPKSHAQTGVPDPDRPAVAFRIRLDLRDALFAPRLIKRKDPLQIRLEDGTGFVGTEALADVVRESLQTAP